MAGRTSARRSPLACGLVLATALLGCQQLVVFDHYYPDGGTPGTAGGGGNPGDAGGAGGGAVFCPSGDARTINPEPTPVDVVVALDHSTGMSAKFNDGVSLAAASADALRTVVDRYEEVNFALVTFPGPSNCPGDASCCVAPVSSPTAPGFSFALDACNTPGLCDITSQRPIAQALDSSYRFYAQTFDPARYVLLLTSGDPGCGSTPGDSCDQAEFRANDLTRIKVWTEVIGVGVSDGGGCLGKLARAGGLALYATTTTSSADLASKIEDFVRQIARDACRLELRPGPGGDELAVFQNGMPVPYGGPNGWDFDGLTIRLRGTACDRLLTNGVDGLSIKACPNHH